VSRDGLPAELRRRIEADLEPVRPLPPVWRRTLLVAVVAVAVFAVMLALIPLRADMATIPLWLSWGGSALQLLVGLLLIGLALREGVPGAGSAAGVIAGVATLAVLTQALVGFATWRMAPGTEPIDRPVHVGMRCLEHDALLAIPALLITLALLWRALPVRPQTAGLLGGGGAALTADAVTHLLCPVSDLQHVLVWHCGAVVFLMLLGWIGGTIWCLRGRR
jgi:hypothetical protein